MPYPFASPKSLVATEEVDQVVVEHRRPEVAKQLHLAVVPVVLLDYELPNPLVGRSC